MLFILWSGIALVHWGYTKVVAAAEAKTERQRKIETVKATILLALGGLCLLVVAFDVVVMMTGG